MMKTQLKLLISVLSLFCIVHSLRLLNTIKNNNKINYFQLFDSSLGGPYKGSKQQYLNIKYNNNTGPDATPILDSVKYPSDLKKLGLINQAMNSSYSYLYLYILRYKAVKTVIK